MAEHKFVIVGVEGSFTKEEIISKLVAKDIDLDSKVVIEGMNRKYTLAKHPNFKDEKVVKDLIAEKEAAEQRQPETPPERPEPDNNRPPETPPPGRQPDPGRQPETPQPDRPRRPDRPGEEGMTIAEKTVRREARIQELHQQFRDVNRAVPPRWPMPELSPGAKLGRLEREIEFLERKLAEPDNPQPQPTPPAPGGPNPPTPPARPTPNPPTPERRPTPETPEPERTPERTVIDRRYATWAGMAIGGLLALALLIIGGIMLYDWAREKLAEKPEVVATKTEEPKLDDKKGKATTTVTQPTPPQPPAPTGGPSPELVRLEKKLEELEKELKVRPTQDTVISLQNELRGLKSLPKICESEDSYVKWAAALDPPVSAEIAKMGFARRCK